MPNLEWEVAHTLVSDIGELELNATDPTTRRRYQIQSDYKILPSLRVTSDNLSQEDGTVLHPRWKTGLVAAMTVHYVIAPNDDVAYEPACGQDLREMHDLLMTHLNSLRFKTESNQRLLWTPTGYATRRMLDFIQTLAWADPTRESTNETGVTFSLESPLPYAMDSDEMPVTTLGTETVTLIGSSSFKPVFRAHGPTTSFAITNTTTGKVFSYDGGRPGASPIASGHYAEIDVVKGTITLDGDVTYLDAGIDPLYTDFWELIPGDNDLIATGATVDMLWNQAWS